MRVNLDKAEKLIAKIRVAEATLEKLWSEWDSLNATAKAPVARTATAPNRGGNKPQKDSLSGKILTLLEANAATSFTPEEVASLLTTTSPAAKRSLNKHVFRKNIERRGRGQYGAKQQRTLDEAA